MADRIWEAQQAVAMARRGTHVAQTEWLEAECRRLKALREFDDAVDALQVASAALTRAHRRENDAESALDEALHAAVEPGTAGA